MNTERLLPSLQPVALGHASQVNHLHSYRNHLLGPWRSQLYASSSAYENQIWCEKILVHVHLLVQNPVVEGGHHEVAAAGRDAQPVNHEGVIILTVTSLLVLVSFSSFNGIRSEMDQQYQVFNL